MKKKQNYQIHTVHPGGTTSSNLSVAGVELNVFDKTPGPGGGVKVSNKALSGPIKKKEN